MVPRICRECLAGPVLTWYIHVLKVAGLGVVTYGPAGVVLSATNLSSLPIAIITYAAGTAAFGIGAYLMIGPDRRQTIQRLPSSPTVPKAGASQKVNGRRGCAPPACALAA